MTYDTLNRQAFDESVSQGRTAFSSSTIEDALLAGAVNKGFDFTHAKLLRCRMRRSRFEGSKFKSAFFGELELEDARFIDCTFDRSIFDRIVLRSVTFEGCTLRGSSFEHAYLETVNFVECDLSSVSLVRARCDGVRFADTKTEMIDVRYAVFSDCDISSTCDAAVQSVYGLSLDWRATCKSLRSAKLLKTLLTAGIPDIMATYLVDSAKAIDPEFLFKYMRSTFISYGGPDAPFARRLRDKLQANGVRTFFFETDAVPGERLHRVMRRVNDYDRIILVCSRASLDRPGVKNEIEETLSREARKGGESYLIPITLDDYIFMWSDYLAQALRDRVVADFRETADDDKFSEAVAKLLKALSIQQPPTAA